MGMHKNLVILPEDDIDVPETQSQRRIINVADTGIFKDYANPSKMGQSFDVFPIGKTVGALNNQILATPVQILNVNSRDARLSAVHTIILDVRRTQSDDPNGDFITPGGPLVGILDYGAGGGLRSKIEFDIPVWNNFGPNYATAGDSLLPRTDVSNGIAFTAPGTDYTLSVRHDGLLRFVHSTDSNLGNNIGMRISGWIAKGAIPSIESSLHRIVHLVRPGSAITLLPAASTAFAIPPFSKRLRFPRSPMNALSITLAGISSARGPVAIPVNVDGDIELSPEDRTILVTNTGAVAITSLKALFDVHL